MTGKPKARDNGPNQLKRGIEILERMRKRGYAYGIEAIPQADDEVGFFTVAVFQVGASRPAYRTADRTLYRAALLLQTALDQGEAEVREQKRKAAEERGRIIMPDDPPPED